VPVINYKLLLAARHPESLTTPDLENPVLINKDLCVSLKKDGIRNKAIGLQSLNINRASLNSSLPGSLVLAE
jgi:hypothetical protein